MSWTIIPTSTAIHTFILFKWLSCPLAAKIIPAQIQGGQTIRFSFDNTFFTRLFSSRSNFTQHHSTPFNLLDKVPNDSIFHSISCGVKNRVKNRIVWPGLYNPSIPSYNIPEQHHIYVSNLLSRTLGYPWPSGILLVYFTLMVRAFTFPMFS